MIGDLQKASLFKRISAFLFDFILLGILAVGLGFIISSLTGFDNYYNSYYNAFSEYQERYGIEFDISEDDYNAFSEEERSVWDEAYNTFISDSDAMYAYTMVLNLSLIIIIFGILFAYVVLEFVVPLMFGNGRTLGKKIFGLAVMRTDGVKITAPLLFIRTILGKFTIETMIPVFIVIMILFNMVGIEGTIFILIILIIEIITLVATKTNSLIHDTLAKTVVVDYASQVIFESTEELIEYKKKYYADQVSSVKDVDTI